MGVVIGGKKSSTTSTKSSAASKPVAAGFLKTGNAAKQAMEKAEVEKKQRDMAHSDEVRRYWMPEDSETVITFLDGDVDEDGIFTTPCYAEHNMFLNGNWRNWFPCVGENEPCPLCEMAEDKNNKTSRATLITLFTVIDHSEFESGGKVYKDQIKLFAAKFETTKKLLKMAQKYGGLAGVTFDVSRGGSQSTAVGDTFIYDQKNTLEDLANTFGTEKQKIQPLDYAKVLKYYTADDLAGLGIHASPAFGAAPKHQGGGNSVNTQNLSEEL